MRQRGLQHARYARTHICPTVPQGLFAVAAISVSTLTFVLMTFDVWVSVTSAKHCQNINIHLESFLKVYFQVTCRFWHPPDE